MEKIELSIPGVFQLRPKVFRDSRGFFTETYNKRDFEKGGIADVFVQDNHSASLRGTIRGLHYQLRHPQAKLCRVIEGEVFDVAVDIRVGSPYFGRWTSVVLSAKEQNQVYIPKGFAHGYQAISERVQFLYKCSDFYDSADDRGILWNDPKVGIEWRITEPTISEKDSRFKILSETPIELLPKFEPK